MNDTVRNILWGADAKNEYMVGEILVADNNLYSFGEPIILNGEYYKVKAIKPIDDAVTIQDIVITKEAGLQNINRKLPGFRLTVEVISETDNFGQTITLELPNAASKEIIKQVQDKLSTANKKIFFENNEIIPDVNYGYAITSHKSQGSTFNNTYVMEDNIINSKMSNKEANQSLYVAVTRPRNKLVIFSQLKEGEFLTQEEKERMGPSGISLQPDVEEDWTSQTNECGI
jgi:chemotaxis response regulator CheB